jgi:RNA polymerase sigma-70 factor, ECF subfamily
MAEDPAANELERWLGAAAGDDQAARRLFPLLYDELHRLAVGCMRNERASHTLQPTALVHEAWLRLSRAGTIESVSSREHFLSLAAMMMRRILVSHARSRGADKRGGGRTELLGGDVAEEFEHRAIDLLALEESLKKLGELDPQQARIVELRFFGGLTVEQCAGLLGLSPRTVQYEWAHARAWLRGQLEGA